MAISQEFGVAVLIAWRVFDANSVITAMTNGINATNPLAPWRDSRGTGKFAPSPTRIAIASHDARNAATTNGMMVFPFAERDVRCAAIAAIAVCAPTMKIARAKTTKAVRR